MMRYVIAATALVLSALLVGACKVDGGKGNVTIEPAESPTLIETAVDVTPTEADVETPTDVGVIVPGEIEIPPSALAAPLIETYDTATPGVPPDDADLPAPAGSVFARWYKQDGFYVVYYAGFDFDGEELCPGSSIETAGGFEHVTNQGTSAGNCGPTTDNSTPRVFICGDDLLYVTAIPDDADGALYGTLEEYRADGTIIGMTSHVTADPEAAPDIDVSECLTPIP
jgi:hypothetical protein